MLNNTMVSVDGDVDAAEQTDAQSLAGRAACALAHHAAPVHCASAGKNFIPQPSEVPSVQPSPIRSDTNSDHRVLTHPSLGDVRQLAANLGNGQEEFAGVRVFARVHAGGLPV